MKVTVITSVLIWGMVLPIAGNAHTSGTYGDFGMMGRHMGGHGMPGYNMMINETGCPNLMRMGTSADYLLVYRDQLGLSKTQVTKLETIRNNYQNDAVALQTQHQSAMYKLHNLLSENELYSNEIRAANAEIERIESELRTKNIETYIAAKLILTRDQLDRVNDLGIFDMQHMHKLR
jgi:hypothetical protein